MLSLKQICGDVAAASSCEVSVLRRAWENKGIVAENAPTTTISAPQTNVEFNPS